MCTCIYAILIKAIQNVCIHIWYTDCINVHGHGFVWALNSNNDYYGSYRMTIQTANLAREKNNFRQFWIDMQRGYFSLLLEDYSPQVFPDQKYVYSSLVKRLSSQEQVVDHLKFAFKQVTEAMKNVCACTHVCVHTHRQTDI